MWRGEMIDLPWAGFFPQRGSMYVCMYVCIRAVADAAEDGRTDPSGSGMAHGSAAAPSIAAMVRARPPRSQRPRAGDLSFSSSPSQALVREGLERVDQLRDKVVEIPDDRVLGREEDGGVWIRVDGQYLLRSDACPVRGRTAHTECDVEVRADEGPGLAELVDPC